MNPTDLDRRHVWHPFTPNDLWLDPDFDPVVITEGQGSWLMDNKGRRYLDGNSSIWTNLHGHRHPVIDRALRAQLEKIAHSSFLGLTNDTAPLLASRLAGLIQLPAAQKSGPSRCFFSDDGSTAMETALKMVLQYFRQTGQPQRTRFISLGGAYHGDTVGAMSLGHSGSFHAPFRSILFRSEEVPSPACYRCPFNKAKPQAADARTYSKCQGECIDIFAQTLQQHSGSTAAWVLEPKVQGAAGFLMHPEGYLEKTSQMAQDHGAMVILDEVMTGFYRTGKAFAHHHEKVSPDAVALAKGMTGGYLPMAATLVRESIFEGFSGGTEKTFYHGHSYTGNQLGSAAAHANLDLLQDPEFEPSLQARIGTLRRLSQKFWDLPQAGDVRLEGFILAVELVADRETREPFPPEKRLGHAVCRRARDFGLLTRPVGDVLVLMPPYSTTESELETMVDALYRGIEAVFA